MAEVTRRAAEVPIACVTLLEDRAHVVRRGAIRLEAAGERVRVERIAPVAADRTLSVRASGEARVVDARIRRRAVILLRDPDAAQEGGAGQGAGEGTDADAARAALDAELAALEMRIAEQRSELSVMTRQAAALDQAAALSLSDLAQDVAWGEPIAPDWPARLDEAAAEERALAARQVAAERRLAELERERERLKRRIAALARPDAEERADLEIDLAGPAGASCEIEIDYVVPGACWRPWHTARLEGAGEDGAAIVEIATDGCVWQNTGEDWREVELVFSTERASLGARPPRLASDVLRAVRRSEQVVVQTREQEIDTAGLGGAAPARAAAELPGIDDAGEVVELRAPGRATVPSDGRPYRVRLGSFTCEATTELVAMPELAAEVLRKSSQENRGAAPLLAGPVDLVRSSGLVGRTQLLYVAPGERFELGWGPEPDLRVSREVDLIEERSRMLSSWTDRMTRIRVRLSNLGAARRRVAVTERVPVSEIEKVKIEVDPARVTDRARPDQNGFLRWTVELEPHGHRQLDAVYVLRSHEDVVGL